MAVSSASSRRATCSRCTRSVVRANSTRPPVSTTASPTAAGGRGEEREGGPGLEPHVAGGERHHLRPGDHLYTVKVEGGERLACRQPGLGHGPPLAAARQARRPERRARPPRARGGAPRRACPPGRRLPHPWAAGLGRRPGDARYGGGRRGGDRRGWLCG